MPAPNGSASERGIVKLVALLVVAVVALAGFGVYWYFIRDTAPPEAKLVDRSTVDTTSGPDGTWTVKNAIDTFSGFRISETFGPLDHTAVVRTSKNSGTFELQGQTVRAARITADLTAIESKDEQPPGAPNIGNRIRFLQDGGLQVRTFPTATFELSEPAPLGAAPQAGKKFTINATGKLTIHGVSHTVTIPIDARWNGAVVDVSGSLDVKLSDYGMSPPSLPFVSVEDTGTLEFQLTFAKA